MPPKPIQFTRSSRKHRVGRGSARNVIDTTIPTIDEDDITGATVITWIGHDERDRELEIIAVDRPDCWLVIHVMPTALRRKR